MHAVSKIQISQSALLFHARARGRRVAQLEPPAGKCCWRWRRQGWPVKSGNQGHKDLVACDPDCHFSPPKPAAASFAGRSIFPLAILAALRGGRARVHEKEELTD